MGLLWEVQYTFAKCSVSLVTSLLFPMPSSELVWNQSLSGLRVLRAKGRLGERSPENGVYYGLCRATKIDAGNIREQHCLQRIPARLFWKLAYIFIARIPQKAVNQCQQKQNEQGGMLTLGRGAGREWDCSSCSVRTCSRGRSASLCCANLLHLLLALLACPPCLGLIQG